MSFYYDNPLKKHFGTVWYMWLCVQHIAIHIEADKYRTWPLVGERCYCYPYGCGTVLSIQDTGSIGVNSGLSATVEFDGRLTRTIWLDYLERRES